MIFLQIINASTFWIYLSFLYLYLIFFFITLEEYFEGSLDFPMINAVNEGTTSTFLILLIGVFAGNEVYQIEIIWGLKFYEFIFIAIIIGVSCQILHIMYKLFRNHAFSKVFISMLLFVYLTGSYLAVTFLSNNSIVLGQQKIILYIYTMIFTRVIITIMIGHIFHSNYNQIQVFPILIATLMLLSVIIENFVIDCNYYFYIVIYNQYLFANSGLLTQTQNYLKESEIK